MYMYDEGSEFFFCELCNDDFSTKKDFYDHLRIHFKEDPFVCTTCERKYYDKDLLIGHLGFHSNKRASICSICKKGFVDKDIMNAHARNHAEREPYICDVYEMEFSKTTEQDESRICDVFAMEFTDNDATKSIPYVYNAYEASNMIRHLRFHTREKASVCTVCTPNVYDECGAEARPQSCSVRQRGFNERGSLAPFSVSNIKEEEISVEEWSAVLSERQSTDKHLLNQSRRRKTLLLCDTCRKGFSGKYDLLVHLRTHTKKKDFVCQICKEEFLHKCNLKKHLCQFHPNEIPFVCEICRKSFSDRDRLITHIFTHTEGRAVVCETCKKGTYQKRNRDAHVRKHTREKPFICDVYERRFSDVDVIRHVRFHPEEKASICELCKKGFLLEL